MATTYIFISPHLDDVVLSCGGYVRRLTSAGERVIIATIVTADAPPGTPLSWLMRRNLMAWRLGNDPFAPRRSEDATATQSLGAEYAHLDLLDAMYRLDSNKLPFYTKTTTRVPIHPGDRENYLPVVRRKLEEIIHAPDNDLVQIFCPLALGKHVDHILIRDAVETLNGINRITYYEDYPYADRFDMMSDLSHSSNAADWQLMMVKLTPSEIEARINAISSYASQLPGLFPSTIEIWKEIWRARLPLIGPHLDWSPDLRASRERMATSLRSYITRVGGERYWHRNKNLVHSDNQTHNQ